MIGVVLSGGQSSRMGNDKGLLKFNNALWTSIVREKLAPFSAATFISINQQQQHTYSKYFKKDELVVDNQKLLINGPLVGLLSVHLKFPDEDIMIAACDMIAMEGVILEQLLKEYNQLQPDAIAYKGANVEPLCAIYSSKGLEKIYSVHCKGKLARHSMIHALENLETIYLPINQEWQVYFKNFNRPEDLL